MSDHENPDSYKNLLEYRVQKLEEGLLKLTALTEIVTRWDERFSQIGGVMPCNLHSLRIVETERKVEAIVEQTKTVIEDHHRIEEIAVTVEKHKAFVSWFMGGLAVVTLVIQLLGPLALDYLKPAHSAKSDIQIVDPTASFNLQPGFDNRFRQEVNTNLLTRKENR